MTKDPESNWVFGQRPVPSAKLNRMVRDYVRRPQPIVMDAGAVDNSDGTVFFGVFGPAFNWAPYPYDPTKQIHDRMRVIGAHEMDHTAVVTDAILEYTLDSGATWAVVAAGGALPFAMGLPMATAGNQITHNATIDLSGIPAFRWIGLRFLNSGDPVGNVNWFTWSIIAFLYRADDDPF